MDTTTALKLLETMLRIRKAELALAVLYRNGKVPCAAHLYEGQEGVAAGICAPLGLDDCITSTHRGHGHCLAKGMAMREMIAEVCGKRTGCCGGKGGTMHLFKPAVGVMGTIGIVGGGIPLATGLGLAMQMQGTERVAVSFFGDGAANNGAFHESLNLAAVWKLPVIYVCENNLYATSVSVNRGTSVVDIGIRGAAYGIPGVTVDGNRVDVVYAAAAEAVARARAGDGPTLIECKTYRIRGHFEGDDCLYRSKEEVAEARQHDPIDYWRACLTRTNQLDESAWSALVERVDKEVEEAVRFADESPLPAPREALELTGKP